MRATVTHSCTPLTGLVRFGLSVQSIAACQSRLAGPQILVLFFPLNPFRCFPNSTRSFAPLCPPSVVVVSSYRPTCSSYVPLNISRPRSCPRGQTSTNGLASLWATTNMKQVLRLGDSLSEEKKEEMSEGPAKRQTGQPPASLCSQGTGPLRTPTHAFLLAGASGAK